MQDKNKVQPESTIERFFKLFGESFIKITKTTIEILFALLIVGIMLFIWTWGIYNAFNNNFMYLIIPIILTMIFFAIITALDKL